MVHWIWIVVACVGSGSLGMLIMAMFCEWNRRNVKRLQRERDALEESFNGAMKKLDDLMKKEV